MIGTGKYNFPGMRKAGEAILNALLASSAWGAWLLASPFKPLIDLVEDFGVEWLANRGLIIIDLGAIYVNGVFDQAAYDQAFDQAIKDAKQPGLSAAQQAVIDNAVIKALRQFGRIGNT